MKKIIGLLSFILISNILFAQEEETRDLSSFDKIQLGGEIELILEKGSKERATITCTGQYTLSDIKTEVSGSTLYIKPKDGKDRNGSVKVQLTFKSLEKIGNSGACKITSESTISATSLELSSSGASKMELDINCDELEIDFSGATKVDLSGRADKVELSISGAGKIDAFDLQTKETDFDMSGAGKVNISISEAITGSISGAGKVTYRGQPEIEKIRISGAGKVKQVN